MRTHIQKYRRLAVSFFFCAVGALPHAGSAAAADLELVVESVTVPAGTSALQVPIVLTNDVPVRGLQFEIRDVPDVLTLRTTGANQSGCAPRATAAGATCLVNQVNRAPIGYKAIDSTYTGRITNRDTFTAFGTTTARGIICPNTSISSDATSAP